LRTFNVIGDFNRECLAIDVDFSLPTKRVIRSLEKLLNVVVSLVRYVVIMALNISVRSWLTGQTICKLPCNTFSPVSQPRMLMLSDLMGQQGVNGLS